MARRAGIKIDIGANVAQLSSDMNQASAILQGFERKINTVSNVIRTGLFAGLSIAPLYAATKAFQSLNSTVM